MARNDCHERSPGDFCNECTSATMAFGRENNNVIITARKRETMVRVRRTVATLVLLYLLLYGPSHTWCELSERRRRSTSAPLGQLAAGVSGHRAIAGFARVAVPRQTVFGRGVSSRNARFFFLPPKFEVFQTVVVFFLLFYRSTIFQRSS